MEKLLRNKVAIIVFIAPAAILFTTVLLVPIIYAIYTSFCDWQVLTPPEWIGLDNYVELLTNDSTMKIALKNTAFFTLFSLVTQQILGMFLAVILTNIKKGKSFFKNTYYMPCVLSSAALGLLFSFLLNPKMGINQVLGMMGIEGPLWLMDVKGFMPLPMWVIGTVASWQYVGTTMMLYMAGISGISNSLYEASYIDGATKVKTFWHVTLPLIKPMMKTTISLTCIGSLKFFDLVYNMTQAGPNYKTSTLATHLYEQGFKFTKYGYASAVSVILLVLSLTITVIINKAVKTEDYEM